MMSTPVRKNSMNKHQYLRNGDLVRISEVGIARSKKLKDRWGQLGRIFMDTPVSPDKSGLSPNELLYTVEWVLGGRTSNIKRDELQHTTAEAEGMTDRKGRQKRKPADFMSETSQRDEDRKKARKGKPQATAKAAPQKTKTAGKKPTVHKAKASKPAAKTRAKAAKKRGPGRPKKGEPSTILTQKKSSKQESKSSVSETPRENVLDLYQKHRRELERILTRLEKVDKFGYFLDDVPREFDERLPLEERLPVEASGAVAKNSVSQDTTTSDASPIDVATSLIKAADSSGSMNTNGDTPEHTLESKLKNGGVDHNRHSFAPPSVTSAVKPHDEPVYPTHAPFNWNMIRRRMEQGRYTLDRDKQEEDERFEAMGKYYKTLGRKRPRRHYKEKDLDTEKKSKSKNPRILHPLGVDWDLFQEDVIQMCDAGILRDPDEPDARDSMTFAANKIKEAVRDAYARTGRRHMEEMRVADARHKYSTALSKYHNTEAAMQSWRQTPFPERKYERLSADKVCDGLSSVDEGIATYELKTSLPDSFVGISYRYDDTGQSEAWMKSVVDETGDNTKEKDEARKAALALAADDGVTRAQVVATMQTLLIGVQDRVMTDTNVLHQKEVRSVNWKTDLKESGGGDESAGSDLLQSVARGEAQNAPEIVEQPVWGIDCYTRRNITLCLEVEFDSETAVQFIEKWLLPAINACPEDLAPDIGNAARLLEGIPFCSPHSDGKRDDTESETHNQSVQYSQTRLGVALIAKIVESAPLWLRAAAGELRRARDSLGPNFFRIHPKGHGSVLLSPKVEANRLITFYRGELYPSWRWGEKMDAIALTQERKNLKPALPDFYNMALERPQIDPRGYGLLFVDASRKAGFGSSLSHSCEPTCEVRVAALNGELCLAMTTLRELEMGEELAFDYNAVTESLNEYSSAVCLCGHKKCRGSFLHFAAADCYQQVLNRNAPIATRFSNLVKCSMKQVMSDDDSRVLCNHGFRTASFGAISVNRREVSNSALIDSLEVVPVWLKTYAADVLRYIEYERRALPISLICDHLSNVKKKNKDPQSVTLKEPRLEPVFFFFCRVEHTYLRDLLRQEGFRETSNGLKLKNAVRKVASACWQALGEDKKKYWKDRAEADYQKRRKEWSTDQKKSQASQSSESKKKDRKSSKLEIQDVLETSSISFEDADAEGVAAMEQRVQQLTQSLSRVGRVLDRHREKTAETTSDNELDAGALRSLAHAPLSMLEDEKVVGWLWNSHEGVVRTLLRKVENSSITRPVLLEKLNEVKRRYAFLDRFGDPTSRFYSSDAAHNGTDGRRDVKEALLQMRRILLDELKEMGREFRRFRSHAKIQASEASAEETKSELVESDNEVSVEAEETFLEEEAVFEGTDASPARSGTPSLHEDAMRESEEPDNVSEVVESVLNEIVDEVVRRQSEEDCGTLSRLEDAPNPPLEKTAVASILEKRIPTLKTDPWLEFYNLRFVLDVSADVLLFYAHTRNFFVMNPYHVLESTPLDVYARELGNAVPRSAVDEGVNDMLSSSGISDESPRGIDDGLSSQNENLTNNSEDRAKSSDEQSNVRDQSRKSKASKAADCDLCEPDDIVATVSIRYQGDYVLSQLLQWYNGGIGQKSGLPDLLGSVLLPSLQCCWESSLVKKSSRTKPEKRTLYATKIRSCLIQWLQDPFQRGNCWAGEIRRAFESSDDSLLQFEDSSDRFLVFGSPIVDFLATGDESTIFDVLADLDADDKVTSKTTNGLLSSLDKGRPAQAVSNWVQCENPECLKWRKIPWNVDVDLLPEKFYCKDNKWNPSAASCDVPEDEWGHEDSIVDKNGKVEGSPPRRKTKAALSPLDENNFFKGARFDVRRAGKDSYCVGIVSLVDFSGKVKRVLFHFPKKSAKFDEWIEFGSDRIARLNTRALPADVAKEKQEKAQAAKERKESVAKEKARAAKERKEKAAKEKQEKAQAKMERKEKAARERKEKAAMKVKRKRGRPRKNPDDPKKKASNTGLSMAQSLGIPLAMEQHMNTQHAQPQMQIMEHVEAGNGMERMCSSADANFRVPGAPTFSVGPIAMGQLRNQFLSQQNLGVQFQPHGVASGVASSPQQQSQGGPHPHLNANENAALSLLLLSAPERPQATHPSSHMSSAALGDGMQGPSVAFGGGGGGAAAAAGGGGGGGMQFPSVLGAGMHAPSATLAGGMPLSNRLTPMQQLAIRQMVHQQQQQQGRGLLFNGTNGLSEHNQSHRY